MDMTNLYESNFMTTVNMICVLILEFRYGYAYIESLVAFLCSIEWFW